MHTITHQSMNDFDAIFFSVQKRLVINHWLSVINKQLCFSEACNWVEVPSFQIIIMIQFFFYVLGSVKQHSILKQLQIKCVCCKVTCYVFGFCKGKFGLSLMLNIGTQLPENDS